MTSRLQYLLTSAVKTTLGIDGSCPCCGGAVSETAARKYLVTTLKRCSGCGILFRAPTTTQSELRRYYRRGYESGLTTDLPSPGVLDNYLSGSFAGTEKDFSRYISILDALGIEKGALVLDYGCSWGYGTWQLKEWGYDAVGYDVSPDRISYGRQHLGLTLYSTHEELRPGFDAVFSSHVVEHVPDVPGFIKAARSLLKPGGLLVTVTPNGSMQYRARKPANWMNVWGYKHPVLIDEVFLFRQMKGGAMLATTRLNDYARLSDWAAQPDWVVDEMTGWELLFVVKEAAPFREVG